MGCQVAVKSGGREERRVGGFRSTRARNEKDCGGTTDRDRREMTARASDQAGTGPTRPPVWTGEMGGGAVDSLGREREEHRKDKGVTERPPREPFDTGRAACLPTVFPGSDAWSALFREAPLEGEQPGPLDVLLRVHPPELLHGSYALDDHRHHLTLHLLDAADVHIRDHVLKPIEANPSPGKLQVHLPEGFQEPGRILDLPPEADLAEYRRTGS